MPISGNLNGRVGQKYFYKQAETGMQSDFRPKQVTAYDMSSKIKEIEADRPSYLIGIQAKVMALKLQGDQGKDQYEHLENSVSNEKIPYYIKTRFHGQKLLKKGRDLVHTNVTAVAKEQSIINNRAEVYQGGSDTESPRLVKDTSMQFENDRLHLD